MNRWKSTGTSYTGAALLAAAFFIIWEAGARWYDTPYILPAPSAVLQRLWELADILFLVHLPATLLVIVTGLAVSIICGVGIAVLMSRSRAVEKSVFPLLITSQTIPIIALAPIFVLWFGYSMWSKVAVTVLITFFPITVGAFDGLRAASKDMEDLLRTMGAGSWQIFRKVQVPMALPSFYSGLKVAVTLSVIGAAIGEWLGADAGLGYFSRRMMTQMDAAGVFAPIVLLSLLGIGLFLGVKAIEYVTTKKGGRRS